LSYTRINSSLDVNGTSGNGGINIKATGDAWIDMKNAANSAIWFKAGGLGDRFIGVNSNQPNRITISGSTWVSGTSSVFAGGVAIDGRANTSSPGLYVAYGITYKGTLTNASDIKFKENIVDVENGLDTIAKLRGVTYNWKDRSKGEEKQYGVIAQEIEQVLPELVSVAEPEGQESYKAVNYIGLIAPMIEAIKELKAEIDSLKAQLKK
jgi:hypothetical protein